MLLRDMEQKQCDFGKFTSQNGEEFSLVAVMYETPAQYDYWMVIFSATHAQWGAMRFQAIIPKKIAPTKTHAEMMAAGQIADQVRASLAEASPTGRNLAPVFSFDGWSLI